MITPEDMAFIAMCLEGFLFGKLFVLCALALPLILVAKEVQLFPNIGVYSGIFALYFQFPSIESRPRTSNFVFYILCLLYVLCAATAACDLLANIFSVSNNLICKVIIYHQLCRLVSIHRFNFKLTYCQHLIALWMFKTQ